MSFPPTPAPVPAPEPPGFLAQVAARLGVVPTLFEVAASSGMGQALWAMAQAAYLDNLLPTLLKERLVVYLSRRCPVRYCLVRHVGFLTGHGYPAGDAAAAPHTFGQALALLTRPLPDDAQAAAALARLAAWPQPAALPAPASADEADLFAALAAVFAGPHHAGPAREAVRRAVGGQALERLLALLAYVRLAHYWTETHPALPYEPDMVALLAQYPQLAALLLAPPEAEHPHTGDMLRRTLGELAYAQIALVEQQAQAAAEQARATEALGESEARFRRLSESNIVGIAFFTTDGVITEANDAFLTMLGLDRPTLQAGRVHWDAYTPAEWLPRTYQAAEELRRTGVITPFEKQVMHPDGTRRWGLFAGSLLHDGASAVAMTVDVTERKLAEEQLQALAASLEQQVAARTRDLQDSRTLLQTVFDASPVSISVYRILHDASGQVEDFEVLMLNAATHRLVRRSVGPGERYLAAFPNALPNRVFDQLMAVAATGEPADFERWYVSGELQRWLRITAVRQGELLVVNTEDITPRKQAELERTLNLRLLEQSEQVAEMGNWDYEIPTGAFRWSGGMYRLFGLAPGTPVAPETYLDFVVPDDRAVAERLVDHLRGGSAGFEKTLRIQVKAQIKTLRTRALMLYDEQGQPLRMLGVDLDISEVQRLEQENLRIRLTQQQERIAAVLEAQEEERRRMAESLHNGLGQILYATKLQLDQLMATPALATAPELATARHESSRLLSEAIRQARTISHELTPGIVAEFGLMAALQDICRSLNSLQLRWQCLVHLDEEQLLPVPLQVAVYRLAQEVTQNIVKHARASYATLEVETLPGWLVLRAEDNGQGFEPTARTTGIGLKTLRHRVALLGGTVHLASTPGQGTQLQVRIPLPTLLSA